MENQELNRRSFLRSAGLASLLTTLPGGALALGPERGNILQEAVPPRPESETKPKYSVNFAVCGMSHDHIYGMVGAMQRGGGILVSAYGQEPEKAAVFAKRFPGCRMVTTEDAILDDNSIQLVLSSTIPNQRAPLGVRVMKQARTI